MKTIGIDQSLFTKSSFEHRCMNNIKNIYQHAGKCDDQQNLKDIIDAAMVSTPEGVTDHSPNAPMPSTLVKKTMLGNHYIFSPTYCMLNRKQQGVVLWLQNLNAEPSKLVITCGPIKQNKKGIQKSMSRSNIIYMHG